MLGVDDAPGKFLVDVSNEVVSSIVLIIAAYTGDFLEARGSACRDSQ